MSMRRWLSALLLAALLLALPADALAAKKPTIKMPVKVGLMQEGGTVTVKPKVKRIKASELIWESSDEGVALAAGGRIKAVAVGKSVITASGGGASAKLGVVVLPKEVSVKVGEKFSLPRGGVEKYTMGNKKIATVSKKGVIAGKKAGATKLKVKYGRQKLTIKVTVTAPAAAPEESAAEGSEAAKLECASQTDQIVLVDYISGSTATLSVHEKQNGTWKKLFESTAYVGRKGLGKTVAGDERTPVGTYNLTTPFGIKDDPGANMPYTKVTKYHYWCGDSSSKYYNQLVDERTADRKHNGKDEYLINYKGVYNYCMFIDYNAEGTPGKGSCIFLHCTGSKKSTGGCVAVPQSTMKKIIQWARPGVKIVIR
ncbi:MAG: L,D-transpeptidase family protein [Clostridia bacterium]|nr:L,D-transpeptidase family protein [Clostridia bacterium]